MSGTRKWGILLTGLFLLLAFFGKTSACFVEHAGIFHCHEQSASHDAPSNDSTTADSHCCHVHGNAALLPEFDSWQHLVRNPESHLSFTSAVIEGPVREIEHPPQLLS